MLDLRLATGRGLLIETPAGDVEVWADDVQSENEQVVLDVILPDEWQSEPYAGTYKLQQEFAITTPEGPIRVKVLRFRPKPDGTGGSVSLGIDAPREWKVSR